MTKAGEALKHVMAQYAITQTHLAETMGIDCSTVNQWVDESQDPWADSVPEILAALETLNLTAAYVFLSMYLQPSKTTQDA
ncbi:helix-turn-helix domain-containing protein [Leptothoe kymatousa]|uniref:Helix-turn-helix transcriptional regulator n=1 Tax=Leptothoe kymatousa TAU-MAC 1615 TaxID=2364775 RepID=A0ABS5Y764_9CYAN|nr:helix-turn-helix transcriptional regulator [Leptothoe kymatousa]MBT9313655.1 helix-turn-helix transcriptional regulator [Leptothoe kymatousa TAU-MAC 1615]